MLRRYRVSGCLLILFSAALGSRLWGQGKTGAARAIPAPALKLPAPKDNKAITEIDCTSDRLGSNIPASSIVEPVPR